MWCVDLEGLLIVQELFNLEGRIPCRKVKH